MKYNAVLYRRGQFNPVNTVLEMDIPSQLSKENKMLCAAHELMKDFRIELEPIKPERKHRLAK